MGEETVLANKISVLPEDLVGRIAAGEVVERPASVVKELVENAIDAQSSRIEVDLKGGGRLLIRIQDDGEGMSREDSLLAFERHATSKIRTDEDLLAIRTLGFRGEALPSIAAVSKVRMVTLARASRAGTELVLEGGRVVQVRETGAPSGTLIEVRELFFNTPARLKFLKTTGTELGHISHTIHQQALAHPHISFRLTHEGRQILNYPRVSTDLERVRQVYGKAFADPLIEVHQEWTGTRIWGLISKPPNTRGTRAYQELFINRRAVSCPPAVHAVYEAYDAALMKGQHPVILLFMEMDGKMLDVNVHPSKREVRFQDQRLIHDLIKGCVQAGLQRAVRADLGGAPSWPRTPASDRVREAAERYLAEHPRGAPGFGTPEFATTRAGRREDGVLSPMPEGDVMTPELKGIGGEPGLFGQVFDTYILAEIRGALWMVDQHAAHERVLYERYLEAVESAKVPVQRLLFPQTLEILPAHGVVLADWVSQLEALGIEVEPFGPKGFVVRSVPTYLAKADLQEMLIDIIDEWVGLQKLPSLRERQQALVATMACHAAVKANEKLTDSEQKVLLRDILQLSEALTCPHGRPLMVKFTQKALERMFRR